MSEYIDNVTRRKQIILNVLRGLHEGKSLEEVKAEFGALAAEISSAEIAEVEQMLMNEGLPAEEIQRLCDVHVAVFRDNLDNQRPPEAIPGHPVHTFRAENQIVLRLLDAMAADLARWDAEGDSTARPLTASLENLMQLDRHYLRKENMLFPYLEQVGFRGPSTVMWGIHDDIRGSLRQLKSALAEATPELKKISALFNAVAMMIREMVYKEEKILLPAALERLKEADWVAIRDQENEIGYCLITPGNEWMPRPQDLHAADPQPLAQPQGSLPEGLLALSTGALSLEQINLMLCNLPVDITYVDENDEVRFFSQTRERIFDRTPAIIGRTVQNCHPPQSVHRVQQILDDFRAGLRSVAEFWIQMGGKFVHIRYFALRDAAGKYHGTLEVTQDVAGIRALQGERRLLDDAPARP